MPTETSHTYSAQFRVPRVMWEAYGRIAGRLGSDRSAMLLEHIRSEIKAHGDAADLADLERAEQELTARRARKGGRPARKSEAPKAEGAA